MQGPLAAEAQLKESSQLLTVSCKEGLNAWLQHRWRAKIDPVLKDEENQSAFDIHRYAERIIGRLQAAVPEEPAEQQACGSFTH